MGNCRRLVRRMVQSRKISTRAVDGLRKARKKRNANTCKRKPMKKKHRNKKEMRELKLKRAVKNNIERIMAKRALDAERGSLRSKKLEIIKPLPKAAILTKGKKNLRKSARDE